MATRIMIARRAMATTTAATTSSTITAKTAGAGTGMNGSKASMNKNGSIQQDALRLVEEAKRRLAAVSSSASSEENKKSSIPAAVTPISIWSVLHRQLLKDIKDFNVHQACYHLVYNDKDGHNNNNIGNDNPHLWSHPCWIPSTNEIARTNVTSMMQKQNFSNYQDLYNWSITNRDEFWIESQASIPIVWDQPPTHAFSGSVEEPTYFPNAKLNIANSCLQQPNMDKNADDDEQQHPAIIYGNDPYQLQSWTVDELTNLTNQVADSITNKLQFSKGTAIAICMPMIPESIAIYLGIVKSGCVVVSIADSFSAEEITTRLRISKASAIFTQDVIYRDNGRKKVLPLYERVLEAQQLLLLQQQQQQSSSSSSGSDEGIAVVDDTDAKESKQDEDAQLLPVVVLPAALHTGSYQDKKDNDDDDKELHSSVDLRPNLDVSWQDFVQDASTTYDAVSMNAMDPCNILFSSGTTGEPKAIVWSHATPIKCAVDGYYHQNIQPKDRIAWPTNIGWMMGPWLLFQRMHGATICLFQGLPHSPEFCKFVETSKVTMLGVIPSLVKVWQTRNALEHCDWSNITRFSSTGEASDPNNYFWLMSRVPGYAPVMEYCGGTEIGGSFLSSNMNLPNIPSMFATPVLGSEIALMQDDVVLEESKYEPGTPNTSCNGELVLIPPCLGWSTKLLNRNHYDVYFKGMPGPGLRRHGDEMELERLEDGQVYYRALGRCDDTMNLGGIKISSVELERVCNLVDNVKETAAIAIANHGGPSRLVVYAVLKHPDDDDDMTNKDDNVLQTQFQGQIKAHLNPLFCVSDVVVVDSLPRTASNKVMRRVLRDQYIQNLQKQQQQQSHL